MNRNMTEMAKSLLEAKRWASDTGMSSGLGS